MKKPTQRPVLSDTRLQVIATACYITYIKAVLAAMTNQLYTIPIKSRKPIAFINALVSPMRCEYVSFPWEPTIRNANDDRQKVAAQIGTHRALPGSRIGTTVKGLPKYTVGHATTVERAVTMRERK